MYDYNEVGEYILKEAFAKNVRDKIGNAIKAIPESIKSNSENVWNQNKKIFKEEMVTELAKDGDLSSEINLARDKYDTLAERLIALLNNAAPIGSIKAFAGSGAPEGWLVAQGQLVSKDAYPKLWSVLGNIYGQSNTTSFYLPNMKGKTLVGLSTGDSDFGTLGKSGGAKEHKLTVNEMPVHRHTVKFVGGAANGNHNVMPGTSKDANPSYPNEMRNGTFIQDAGGDVAHNNIQPYITMNYIIKY